MPFSVSDNSCYFYLSISIRKTTTRHREDISMVELNPTVREQEIYEEMELTPEMVKPSEPSCATSAFPAGSGS